MVKVVGRDRLPDAQGQIAHVLPEAERADPAILVMNGSHAARRRHPQALAHCLDVLRGRGLDVAIAEPPARFLA